MNISSGRAILAALIALVLAMPVVAQEANPAASSPPPGGAWPSGDQLRRELQKIGFSFRVDRDSGDWLGWAPRASLVEAPALSLGGLGPADATASFTFDLLQTDLLGGDIDAALTALLEVAARVPIDPVVIERARLFVVDELLRAPPQTLEPCYASTGQGAAIVVTVDAETGQARLHLARSGQDVTLATDLDLRRCAAIDAPGGQAERGLPTSERISIAAIGGDQARFEPAEVNVEGSLVTVVLTFRNDSASDQSLTFEAPLDSDTGPVLPGEVKLIVIRQLTPGDYPFFSSTDPETMTGVIRVERG